MRRTYKIEDKVPIPFIIAGKSDVIDPDMGFDELDRLLGTERHSKAAELLREVLVEARADLFRDIFVGRLADLESSAGETGIVRVCRPRGSRRYRENSIGDAVSADDYAR